MRTVIRGFFLLVLFLSFFPAELAGAATGQLTNLTEVGIFTTHDPHDAEFFKDHLFIADGNSLLVYNTSDPERPKLVTKFSDFNAPGQLGGFSIYEERLYMAAGPGWIYVINISDPQKPERLYQIDYLDSSNDVAVSGGYMYVADANTGLLIFDIVNRRNPELEGMFYILKSNISGSLQGWGGISVEVSGNYAFLSGASNKGLYIIDVSNKTRPREIFHSLGKNVYDIAISGNDVYLARGDGTTEFDLLNVSNIYSPVITGNFSITGTAKRSTVAIHPTGEYIYAASGDTWHIFRRPDIFPPQIIIEEPKHGETVTNQIIKVSGTAFDRNGIKEVLVNGKFAGTESWHQNATLAEGINSINITAQDKKGNYKIEIIQIIYRLPEQTAVSTPRINASVTGKEGINTTGRPVNLIYIAFILIVLIVIFYLVWVYKIRK
ncbi:MAG: hypothetical protein O8C60_02970 [Candidatus Methanoperedens sp.]|nr:hypothetical protein [Candidatus Methanoperedens sp.]